MEDRKKQIAEIPLEFENHMVSILGMRCYGDAFPNEIRDIELSDAKRAFLRYIKRLEDSFEINAATADSELKTTMNCNFSSAAMRVRWCKDITELSLLMVAILGNAYFNLLGGKQYTCKEKNKRSDFILNTHRSISYSQTSEQKACQVLDYLKEYFSNDNDADEKERKKSNN